MSIFLLKKIQAAALDCLYWLTAHLHYGEVEVHGNYTCKSWWESQQHTQHTFLPGSFPIHEKAHEPWIPEAKQ